MSGLAAGQLAEIREAYERLPGGPPVGVRGHILAQAMEAVVELHEIKQLETSPPGDAAGPHPVAHAVGYGAEPSGATVMDAPGGGDHA